jgi:next to BRCA1 gene 1 protein
VLPAKPTQSTVADLLDDKVAEAEKMNPNIIKAEPRSTYLDTVLSQPIVSSKPALSSKAFQDACRPLQASGAVRMPGAFTSDSYVDPPPRPSPQSKNLSQPTIPCFRDFSGTFSIDCNHCGKAVPNEHYHCSICENGDFDLCQGCVDKGINCEGEDHWLIKRFIRNGIIIPSVTETCAPRQNKADKKIEIPAATDFEERTCNSCIDRKSFPSTSVLWLTLAQSSQLRRS